MNITAILESLLRDNYFQINVQTVLSNPEESFLVIKDILKKHGKEDSFVSTFDFNNQHKNRMPHLLVTYCLGWFIIKNIKHLYPLGYSEEDLLQAWMVTSLFHDLMYFKKSRLFPNTVNSNLKNFYTNSRLKPTYSRKELVNYFMMKYENFPEERIDHGIAGGIYLFNSLHFLFYKKTKTLNFNKFLNAYIDEDKHISYSKNDYLLIKDACKAICQHNLFKPSCIEEKERNIYYNLCEINNPNIKIEIKDFLTFILSIVDTIDISKRIQVDFNLFFRYCNNFDISVFNQEIVIRIPDSCFFEILKIDYEDYISSIINLKKWANVNTNKRDGQIIITLI